MKDDLNRIRREYGDNALSKADISKNPFLQFEKWFQLALKANIPDANAMCLSTVSAKGKPTARILLLKDFDQKGFCFFTNYKSKKGRNIDINPHGALVFFWPTLEKQIRIEGKIEKLEENLSDTYFYNRPIGSRIAAAVSPQSEEIENRNSLITTVDQFKAIHGEKFQRPEFWGGYRLIPDLFEFWQGRENRLNDRIEYILHKNNWNIRRLAP